MLNIKIKILDKRLGGDFPLPQYETALSAGMDLRAMVDSDFVLNPGEVKMVNTGFAMHIADPDDLIDIHVVVAADLRQLIGKGNIDCTEGVLHDLGHLGGANVGNNNLALAEG